MAGLRLNIDPSGMVSGGDRAEKALDGVKAKARQAEGAVDRLGKSTKNTSPSMRGLQKEVGATGDAFRFFGGNARLMSMQLSQIGQQGAVTGSYLQAFMVQLPDLALGLGTVGILAGAAVPVIYGFGKGILEAGGSVKAAAERVKALSDAMADLNAINRSANSTAFDLIQTYGAFAGQAREVMAVQREIANLTAITALNAVVDGVTASFGSFSQMATRANNGLSDYQVTVAELSEQFGITRFQATEFADVLRDLSLAQGPEETVTALKAAREQIELASGGLGEMDDKTRELYNSLLEAELAAARLSSIDMASNIGAGADQAARLAQNLITANSAFQAAAKTYGGRGRDPRSANATGYGEFKYNGPRLDQFNNVIPTKAKGGRKGGGVSEAEKAKRAYDSLISSLDPLTRASLQYSKAQTTINEAQKAGQITATEAARAYGLATDRFEKATAEAQRATGVWADFQQAGGSAIDRLIDGASSLKDVLKDVIKELVLAITKKNLLANIRGGSASDSVGGLIFKGLFGGFFDSGGVLPMGKTGVVGENGPEKIRATSRGTVVTSRANTARQASAGSQTININIDGANGDQHVKDLVRQGVSEGIKIAQTGAVNLVKSSLPTWQGQLQTDGALV